MKAGRLFSLGIACVLLATLSTAAGAAPQAGPCAPGTTYDSACDVNHDNQITIDDIQLTAGHWNQTGTWVSDNQHTHLGQTWTGSNNPLKLTGTYGTPEFAPLVLANSGGVGLRIASATSHGLWVASAGNNGLYVDSAGNSGVRVDTAGGDGLTVLTAGNDGVAVQHAGGDGVYVVSADGNGVLVDEATLNGFYVQNATLDGFLVLNAGSYGVRVNRSELDGVAVISSGGDGVDVAAAADNGIEATGTNRAGYFEGDIEVTGTCINCRIAQMAVNTGDDTLLPGQIVAVDGVTASSFDGLPMLVQVRRATPGSALLGVVGGRAEPVISSDDSSTTLVPRAGQPAAVGNYLSVVTFGPMQVKAAGSVDKGQRVTVDSADGVRAVRRVTVDGVALDEGGSSLGIALDTVENGRVWVLVNPQ